MEGKKMNLLKEGIARETKKIYIIKLADNKEEICPRKGELKKEERERRGSKRKNTQIKIKKRHKKQ